LQTVKKCAISALELMPDLVEAFERVPTGIREGHGQDLVVDSG
jgi:hypothetical protein